MQFDCTSNSSGRSLPHTYGVGTRIQDAGKQLIIHKTQPYNFSNLFKQIKLSEWDETPCRKHTLSSILTDVILPGKLIFSGP